MRPHDRIRLQHMLDAAEQARIFVHNKSRADLDQDLQLVWALTKAIEIIGEAAHQVSAETKAQLRDIPWEKITGMRHQLVHAYFDIDLDILWKTVQDGLPPLIAALEKNVESPARHSRSGSRVISIGLRWKAISAHQLSLTSRSQHTTVEQLLREKREESLKIAAKHGARNADVFGSTARGKADEKSDIDLLVEFEHGRRLLDHAALWLEPDQLLGCEVDAVSNRRIKPRVRDRVLKEAVSR